MANVDKTEDLAKVLLEDTTPKPALSNDDEPVSVSNNTLYQIPQQDQDAQTFSEPNAIIVETSPAPSHPHFHRGVDTSTHSQKFAECEQTRGMEEGLKKTVEDVEDVNTQSLKGAEVEKVTEGHDEGSGAPQTVVENKENDSQMDGNASDKNARSEKAEKEGMDDSSDESQSRSKSVSRSHDNTFAPTRARSRSDSFEAWKREHKRGAAVKRDREDEDEYNGEEQKGEEGRASSRKGRQPHTAEAPAQAPRGPLPSKAFGGTSGSLTAAEPSSRTTQSKGSTAGGGRSAPTTPTVAGLSQETYTVFNKGILAQQLTIDRNLFFGAQNEYLPTMRNLPTIATDLNKRHSTLERHRQLLELVPDDDQLCSLHLSMCPLPIVYLPDGSVSPMTFNQQLPPFPKIDVIKRYFSGLGFAVYVHSFVRQANGGSFCFVEFEARDEAIRAFLATGLFTKIGSASFRVGWARLHTTKPAVTIQTAEQRANAEHYAAFLAHVSAAETAKIAADKEEKDSVEEDNAIAAEETGEAPIDTTVVEATKGENVSSPKSESTAAKAPATTGNDLVTPEGTPYTSLLRGSNAAWVEFQDGTRQELLQAFRATQTPPATAGPSPTRNRNASASVASHFGNDTSAAAGGVSGSASAAPTSYLPANYKSGPSEASQESHVAGPMALTRVHSRAHQSKDRPMVILREFGAPRMLVEPADHIRYNRTVLQLTTAVDPLMNYEVLNGQGVYCDTPMYALPFEDERAVYDAVSQFGDVNGITFTPDRRSVFVTFSKPQSVAAAVMRARQANWLEGGVRASALGHSTQGK